MVIITIRTIAAYSEVVSMASEEEAMASPISPLGIMPKDAATDPLLSFVSA